MSMMPLPALHYIISIYIYIYMYIYIYINNAAPGFCFIALSQGIAIMPLLDYFNNAAAGIFGFRYFNLFQ